EDRGHGRHRTPLGATGGRPASPRPGPAVRSAHPRLGPRGRSAHPRLGPRGRSAGDGPHGRRGARVSLPAVGDAGGERRGPERSRREFVRSAGLAGLATRLVGVAPLQSPRAFVVTGQERRIAGLSRPLTAAFLTDLHLGPYLGEDALERWVEATLRLEPDLVLLGGDFVDRTYRGDLAELARHLPRLTAPLGVFAVLGNHDHTRYRRVEPLAAVLAGAGVTLLDNAAARVREDFVLAGIDDLRVGRPDLGAALADAEHL